MSLENVVAKNAVDESTVMSVASLSAASPFVQSAAQGYAGISSSETYEWDYEALGHQGVEAPVKAALDEESSVPESAPRCGCLVCGQESADYVQSEQINEVVGQDLGSFEGTNLGATPQPARSDGTMSATYEDAQQAQYSDVTNSDQQGSDYGVLEHELNAPPRCGCSVCAGQREEDGDLADPILVNSALSDAEQSLTTTHGVEVMLNEDTATLKSTYVWERADESGTTVLTYSLPWFDTENPFFVSDYGSEPDTGFGLNAQQVADFEEALATIEAVANIDFVRVVEDGTAENVGDIRIGFSDSAGGWGYAYYPGDFFASSGDIWVNPDYAEEDWGAGTYNFMAVIHELGHTLGLDHTHEGGNGSTVLDDTRDHRVYSVMSYEDYDKSQWYEFSESGYSYTAPNIVADTPMLLDILALQEKYGANNDHAAGDDTYSFDPQAPFFTAIWDTDGIDTIDVSNFATDSTISLLEGSYSNIGFETPDNFFGVTADYDGTKALSIAYGTDIENAIGGSGDDLLVGNDLDNTLTGGEGDDTLDAGLGNDTVHGGLGDDTLIMNVDSGDVTVTASGEQIVVAWTGNSVTSTGIENFQFIDSTLTASEVVNITPNETPVLTVQPSVATNEDTASASVQFSASDPDNDSLTFSLSASSNGSVVRDGDSFVYTPDDNFHGSDVVTVTVSDGRVSVSEDVTVTVNPINDAPIITSTAITGAGVGLTYSYAVEASDVDGDALTLSSDELPAWLTFNAETGVLSGTPTTAGDYEVSLTAFDGELNADQTFTLSVRENQAPVITTVSSITVNEDESSDAITFSISDADDDEIEVFFSTPSLGSVVDNEDGTYVYTPAENANGSDSFVITASDGFVETTQTVSVTVVAVNDSPSITSSAATSVDVGETYTYEFTASDVDSDVLTLSSSTLPDWMSFDDQTGILTGAPETGDAGEHTVVLSVSDGTETVEQSFTVTVFDTSQDSGGSSLTAADSALADTHGIEVLITSDTPTLKSSYVWDRADESGTTVLTYSLPWYDTPDQDPYFVSDYGTEPDTGFGLNAQQVLEFEKALESIEAVADIDFVRLDEDGSDSVGDIRIGFSDDVGGWGYAYYPGDYFASSGDIWVNPDYADEDWGPGTYNFFAVIHELGHTLGLEHTFSSSYSEVLEDSRDHQVYSVMSYTAYDKSSYVQYAENGSSWTTSNVAASTPMLLDVLALQEMYGENATHNNGDDTYTFDANTPFFKTIWDTAGNDTIDVSNFTIDSTISLIEGSYSNLGFAVPNGSDYDGSKALSIAHGADIENVIGGSGNDLIVGNHRNNDLDGGDGDDVIAGGVGNDTIDGGAGDDIAVIDADIDDVTNVTVSGNEMILTWGQSNYTLTARNIETFRFNDGDQAANELGTITPNEAPTLSVQATEITVNEDTASAAVTFSAEDPEGDELSFSIVAAENGTVVDNGDDSFTYTPDTNFYGTDTFEISVTDGRDSDTQTISVTVTPVNDAPIITSTAITGAGVGLTYSYTVEASDVDGDALTLTADGLPAWLTFNAETGVLSGTPTEGGAVEITLEASDGTLSDTQTINIQVRENAAPVIDTLSNLELVEDTANSAVSFSAVDSDNDEITFVFGEASNGSVVVNESDDTYVYTPAPDFNGTDTFTITANDGFVDVVQTVTVNVTPVNDAPVITSDSVTALNIDSEYRYVFAANDVDSSDTLTYTAVTSLPDWLTFDADTGVLSGTPAEADVGSYAITLRAQDSAGEQATQTFTLAVSDPNDPNIVGSDSDDTLYGMDEDDRIDGGSGNDTLFGGQGSDVLIGAAGDDALNAGMGSDSLIGGEGNDLLQLQADGIWGGGLVAVNVSSSSTWGTYQRVLLTGKNKFSDVSDGGADVDQIQLTDSADAFFLEDSFSAFHSSFDDSSDVESFGTVARVIDIETINAGGGNDIVDLTSSDFTLSAITVNGGGGDDVLWGAEGDDTLNGGTGDDVIFGSSGDDTLTGGLGADTFEFTSTAGSDTITDYNFEEGDSIVIYRRNSELNAVEIDEANNEITWQGLNGSITIGFDNQIDETELSIRYEFV